MNALVIYLDVLIILNVYVNYFLLRTTAKLTHSPLRIWRGIAASFYGSLFSLLILAPELPMAVTAVIRFCSAVTIVMAAFGIHGVGRLVRNTAVFFSANFIFAGVVFAVCTWLRPASVHFSNSCFYIDFSLLTLIITTAVLYGGVCIFRRFTDVSRFSSTRVMIKICGKVTAVEGLADTGNGLIDCFSGRPVMICGKSDIKTIPAKSRLIPCSTVAASGVMQIFRPDEVLIVNTMTGERKAVDVMIGLGETHGKAVFNPKILNG